LFEVGALGSLSDGQLLERFLASERDAASAAFEVLVNRHAPMVFGVCQCILREAHATEDAFQATFLVLVQRARAIRNRDALGLWLHGVAHRVAVRAKTSAVRRRERELRVASQSGERVDSVEVDTDRRAMLHEELAGLPEKYRAPLVLFYLRGMSYEAIARLLRLSPDTVRGRLARARIQLRRRLESRGCGADAGSPALLAILRPPALVPYNLVELTIGTAFGLMYNPSPISRAIDSSILALMQGVLRSMVMSQGKYLCMAMVAIGMIVTGAVVGAQQTQKPAPEEKRISDVVPPKTQTSEDSIDEELRKVVAGRIVRSASLTKDAMILSYLPDWDHGNVDNLGLAENDGGVRALLDWPEILPSEFQKANRRAIIALYSRQTTAHGPGSPIQAFALQEAWPERVSWKAQPNYVDERAASYPFKTGEGWKLFDITPLVKAEIKQGHKGHGVMLRFAREDRMSQAGNWSGFQFHSREATGDVARYRPRLLIVD